ncbi:hypothetical protein Ddc_18698 [Ditylenchus destructor]|nr:hypothetical protein Ddc_18698 [Ditylenchus destructor]
MKLLVSFLIVFALIPIEPIEAGKSELALFLAKLFQLLQHELRDTGNEYHDFFKKIESPEFKDHISDFLPIQLTLEGEQFSIGIEKFTTKQFFENVRNLIGQYANRVCFNDTMGERRKLYNREGAMGVIFMHILANKGKFELYRC